jgi:hypothetical protein
VPGRAVVSRGEDPTKREFDLCRLEAEAAYRWRNTDDHFANQIDDAHQDIVDEVENTIYQRAKGGYTIAGIFYLKAHRPIYRERFQLDIVSKQKSLRPDSSTAAPYNLRQLLSLRRHCWRLRKSMTLTELLVIFNAL